MTSVTYYPNEIFYKGHYYTIHKSTFVGNLFAAKQEAKKQKKQLAGNCIVRRFGLNVNTYKLN